MDVRQYAFLARQSSARVKSRDRFWGMPKRGLAFLLANVMFWQPIWAQADGIVVANPGTSLGQAGNGVPIVNIATPNGSGLSHNQFVDYNVGAQGVILNNGSTQTSSTQLGGIIIGNPNLKSSGSAQTILNEVVGGSPSQLRGYTEVAGQSARVIVANPYGISCNGCGFINTPRVTLTTGKPVLDGNGRLDRFQVDQGSVSIDGAGLNANNVDRFEIITRSAKINAEIQAKNLTIIAGRNDVNADSLNTTARADDGSAKPQLAIDSSALGGMYAGAIKLVGTEAGVGVKLAGNLAASGGDIQIDANGHLSLAQTAATNAVNVRAASLDAQGPVYGNAVNVQTQGNLAVQQSVAARDSISLSAGGVLTSNGVIEAGVNSDNSRNGNGDVSLSAQTLNNSGKSVIASRNLTVTTAQTLSNQGGTLSGKNTTISAGTLDNQNNGRLLGNTNLNLTAGQVLNARGVINSAGNLTGNIGRLVNSNGELTSQLDTVLTVTSLDNVAGLMMAGRLLDITALGTLNNSAGKIASKQSLNVRAQNLDNRNGGLITAAGKMNLTANEVANIAGRISGKGDIEANIATLNQSAGELVAEGNLLLTGNVLDNRQDGLVASLKTLTLNVGQIDNRGGSLSSQSGLLVKGARLDNSTSGKVLSDTMLSLKVDQIINDTSGLIFSKGASTLTGIGLSNRGGKIVSQASLDFAFDGVVNNQQGLINSEGQLTLNTGSLDNRLGKLSSLEDMALTTVGAALNQGGLIATQKGLALGSGSLDNSVNGVISAKADSTLVTGDFNNSSGGSLATDGALNVTAGHLNNSAGQIGSQQQLDLSLASLEQDGGELFSNNDLSLDMNNGLLNNQRGSIHTPGQLLLKNLNEVNNSAGEISGAKAWSLNAQSLNNDGGKLLSNEKLGFVIDRALSNVKGLIAAASLDSRSASLNNADGDIRVRGGADLRVTDDFDNRGGIVIADDELFIKATRLDNRDEGLVGAMQALNLTVDRLDNRNGELSSKVDVNLIGDYLDNSDSGFILAGGNLALTVGQVINRNNGLISGDAGLTLTGDSLENSGRLITQNDLAITLSADLDNQKGSLVSEGALVIDAERLDNDAGTVSSAKALVINTRGEVSNQGGKLLTDSTLTLDSSALDNQAKGVLSSKGDLSITTGVLNNSQASIYSAGQLSLKAGQLTNTGGSLGAGTSLLADVSGLDQQGGKLFSKGDLSLDLKGGTLNNQDGFISAPGQLLLKNLADVNNRGGEISSELGFELIADQLDNSAGQLLSNQKLTLQIENALTSIKGKIAAAALQVRASSLDNSGGVLLSDGDLNVTFDDLLTNRDNGIIKAAQQLNLNSNGLDNQGGTLLGGSGIAIDLGVTLGDLNNQQGLINTKGELSIAHLRDLDNRNGEISSLTSFSLAGNILDNRGGNLISNDQLQLAAAEVRNQGGLVSGWNGVTVSGGTLDNSQEGTISSLLGNLGIDLSGALVNHTKGGLAGKGELSIKAASLDNSNGIVTSGGKQTLTISNGTITNTSGGLIESSDTLDIHAATLNNAAGQITAKKAMSFTGTQLDNTGGSLVGEDSVTLDLLGALTNINGALGSRGPLLVKRASSVDNRGGQLISQSLLSLLTSGDLNNGQGGTLSASGQLDLTADGTVYNDVDGLISSRDAGVSITAAALNNASGAVQSWGLLSVEAGNGAIDNQGGKLIAQTGDLNINAASLDNRGGMLSSLKGLVQARLDGVLRNSQGGKLEGSRLDLRALGGIYSDGGRIAANTGDILLNAGGNTVDNSNGGIFAKGQVAVVGGSMNNNAGQVSGNGIDLGLSGNLANRGGLVESADTLAVRAANLDNQGGKLRALGTSGKTDFQIGSQFDNRNGLVETANQQLTIATPGLLNAGGSVTHVGTGLFDISTANVMNAGGALITRGDLNLNANSWTNSSVIQAGRLTVNVNNFNQTASGQLLASNQLVGRGVNWNNDGLIASDGSLDIQLSGGYGGSGRMSSLGDMQVDASSITLNSAASIAGGGNTSVGARGGLSVLNNFGRLSASNNLNLNAGAVNNYGTLAGGTSLKLSASSLLNDQGGFLFSGGDMKLRGGSFSNRNSDVYSLGAIDIARDDAGSRAGLVENLSGTMESVGNFSIRSDSIVNRRDQFKTVSEMYSADIGVRCYECDELPFSWAEMDSHPIASHLVWEQKFRVSILEGESSKAASITSGSNFDVTGGSFLNSNSSVAASGNITINVASFENSGTATGDYVSRKYVTGGQNLDQWSQIVAYNMYNDADYNRDLRFWNANEVESRVTTQVVRYGAKGEQDNWFQRFGPVLLGLYKQSYAVDFGDSLYASGARTDAPDFIKNAVFSEKIIASDPSGFASAIIQAAGNVTINAVNKITNGVERAYSSGISGTSRNAGTGATGTGKTTIINLNSQLPPDLAQQQVNPLTLPGFSLPVGDNGLFRLSGKDGTHPGVVTNPPRTIASLSGDATQRSDAAPVRDATELQFDDNDPVSVRDRELALAGNPSLNLNNKTAQVNADGVQLPDRGNVLINAPRVQGLPDTSVRSNPHKYLIETNPVLTELKQFMSSDYLLANLGYDPDTSAKRLGDGFFEQRLIQQAVVERTGQRFIDGQTSDEAMFKYLMNNAIASKDELNLSVGVTLTAQQVAALTHDIVWLEEHEVNGEKVLVPVLYLAQADNRLAPNGALIQGRDVTLIAGQDLNNAGTLRATNNLAASAGQDLTNSGLIEGGNRLDLLAGNNIINQSGGVIAGRDVTLSALTGDVINERTVTRTGFSNQGYTQQRDYLDSAARIEAANDLTIGAGRDVLNKGSVISSGRDTEIEAGRDIGIAAAEQQSSDTGGIQKSSITQFGSSLDAGRDISLSAGRDVSIVASDLEAKRNIILAAEGDLTVASAADETHSYYKTKKVTAQEDHIKQIASTLTAGGDVVLSAGNDLALISSRITAGDEAYLVAGNNIELLAAQDSDYSLYDKKKNGSFGQKETRRDEITKVTHVGSEITTGGDLTLVSGGDQRYQVAKLNSGSDLALQSGGAITFEGVKDLHQESHEKSSNSLAWTSAKGRGNTDETLRQSELVAQGNLAIKAVDGLNIDIKQIDQKSVSETIDAMVQADPQLAWLKEAEQRGDVDWRKVQEVHESFKYSHSGLGQGAMLAIMIIVTALTAGAASAAIGTAANAAAASGTAMAAAGTTAAGTAVAAGWGNVALTAVVTSAASGAAISTINNKGDLGAVIKDVTSSDSLKGYVIAGVSGGIAGENIAVRLAVNSALQTVANGGKFKDNLSQAAIGLVADMMAGAIYGQVGTSLLGSGLPTKVAVHAIVGGLIGEAAGGDFVTSAMAAGANKALIEMVGDKIFPGVAHEQVLAMTSQLLGMTVAAAAGGSDKDQQVAGWVAQQATVNNYLTHKEVESLIEEAKTCVASNSCDQVRSKFADLNDANEKRFALFCLDNPQGCGSPELQKFVEDYNDTYDLLSKARASDDIPAGMKSVLATTQMMNAVAKVRLLEMGVALGLIQAGNDAAGQVGMSVDSENVGVFAKWAAILFWGGKGVGAKGGGAVPNLTERGTLTNVFPNDPAIAQRPIRTLVQDSSGRYWLQTPSGSKITPSGSYDFVTMPDGTVRVSRPNVNEAFSTHLGLSGGGDVKYAGSIRFGNNDGPSRGTISHWTNASGHYKPPASLSSNSGLPENLFNPK
ncbi:two-partner secretion domain-containing protein [Pseudomonas sp. Root562]|uniref:two-partner secretion domain-containing protein n=1 Tax=Pseudomonas sp. Root562 TaxID=1736561 RepID=UPI0009E8B65F|nr:filamentous hemagglutinin N-terminal domain-containing protein [Pseudomonas sp. Root562]